MATRSLSYSTGATLRTVLRDYSTGAERAWNTALSQWEPYDAGHLLAYAITTSEGSRGQYSYAVPASLPASAAGYEFEATTYELAAPPIPSVTDLPVWRSTWTWDGQRMGAVPPTNAAGNVPADIRTVAGFADDGAAGLHDMGVTYAAYQGVAILAGETQGVFDPEVLANAPLGNDLSPQMVRDAMRMSPSPSATPITMGSIAETDGNGAVALPAPPPGYGVVEISVEQEPPIDVEQGT